MEKLSSSTQRQFERFCCPQFTTRVFRVSVANDRAQLSKTALAARAAMGKPKLKVLADRGYFSGPEILACDTEGIAAYVPKPSTSASKKRLFAKADFVCIAKEDEYKCPAGERAIYRFPTVNHKLNLRVYWTSACPRLSAEKAIFAKSISSYSSMAARECTGSHATPPRSSARRHDDPTTHG